MVKFSIEGRDYLLFTRQTFNLGSILILYQFIRKDVEQPPPAVSRRRRGCWAHLTPLLAVPLPRIRQCPGCVVLVASTKENDAASTRIECQGSVVAAAGHRCRPLHPRPSTGHGRDTGEGRARRRHGHDDIGLRRPAASVGYNESDSV